MLQNLRWQIIAASISRCFSESTACYLRVQTKSVHWAISLARGGIRRDGIEAGGIPRPNTGTWTLAFLHSTIAACG
jgi:hypothetical protein